MNKPALALTDADLFRSIYPRARRFASFVAPTGMEPDDVLQEALARVLAKGPITEITEPLAYLRMTMLNIVRNEHRRTNRERRAFDRIGPPGHIEDQEGLSGAGALVDALQALPVRSRAAVFLVDLDGYSIREAADIIGLSVSATTARLSRARRTLRVGAGLKEEA